MPYRNKTQESFCEFTVRDRGISDHPTLTIEVETSFCQAFNDQLKADLRHAVERAWDPDGVRWRIHPSALEKAKAIAFRNFKNVYLVEGDKTSDLVNDTSFENLNLFK